MRCVGSRRRFWAHWSSARFPTLPETSALRSPRSAFFLSWACYCCSASAPLRVHRILGVALQRLRQGAVFLCRLRGLPERRLVDAGNLAPHVQRAAGDFGRPVHGFDRDRRARFDALRGMTRFLETGRERHAETPCVRGGEQLLRIRPLLALEARAETEGTAEGPALRLEAPFAVPEFAFPNRDSVARGHDSFPH